MNADQTGSTNSFEDSSFRRDFQERLESWITLRDSLDVRRTVSNFIDISGNVGVCRKIVTHEPPVGSEVEEDRNVGGRELVASDELGLFQLRIRVVHAHI